LMAYHLYVDTEAVPPPESPASLAYAERKGIPHGDLALNPAWAHCVCAGWALDDGEVITTEDPLTFARALYDARRRCGPGLHIVAHNANYDLGVLFSWMLRSGVADQGIRTLTAMGTGKPWERKAIDTAKILGNYYTLDRLAEVLGVQGKTDHIGGSIAELWKADKPRVISYLRGDVEALRSVHGRLLDLGLGSVQ
jgi:hypothetical protein